MNVSQVCCAGHISGLNGGWQSVWICSWSRETCTALSAGRAAIVLVKQPQGGCCCKNSTSTGWSTWSQHLCALRFPPRIITSYMVLSWTCKAAAAPQKHHHVSSFVFSRQIYQRHCWLKPINLIRKLLTESIFVSVRLVRLNDILRNDFTVQQRFESLFHKITLITPVCTIVYIILCVWLFPSAL